MTDSYADDYSTCSSTFATLRIYSQTVAADAITSALGVEPTRTLRPGEGGRNLHGWFLSSEGRVESKDLRRHLDWVLDQLATGPNPTGQVTARIPGRVWADISCLWISAVGHGGPTLSPKQMQRMARLGLECWFDVYLGASTPSLRDK
ncbi:MAG TPA: DUF4279 domain-containing protein [Polyangiales bacterium]|nr:DUF4279 domain-containing protein [Polyangiales bacterium]